MSTTLFKAKACDFYAVLDMSRRGYAGQTTQSWSCDTAHVCEIGWRQEHILTWQPPDLDQPDLGCGSLVKACSELEGTHYYLQGCHSTFLGTLLLLAADWTVTRAGRCQQGCPPAPPRDQAPGEAAAGALAGDCVPGVAVLDPRSFFAAAAERC